MISTDVSDLAAYRAQFKRAGATERGNVLVAGSPIGNNLITDDRAGDVDKERS